MKLYITLLFAAVVGISARSANSANTIILGDGGNLTSAIAAASHGDIIELRSNGNFAGNQSWSDKYLTIRAGTGFHPTIQGSFSDIRGTVGTGGSFQGLNITGGLNVTANGTTFATFIVENSTLQGGSTISGTGSFHADATFNNTDFVGIANWGGTGGFTMDATVNHSTFRNAVYLNTLANENVLNLHFNDSDFLTEPHSGGGLATDHRNLTFSRNRLRKGIDISVMDYNNLTVQMNDNVIGEISPQSPPTDPGILLRSFYQGYASSVRGTFTNNTVVGFPTGIEIRGFADRSPIVEFSNMLLRNTDDLLNVPSSYINYSLVSDGTYNGLSNNFTGVPLLGPNGELLAGSPGIDRGTNSKASTLDFHSNTRILDGDGDGNKVVDVGAYEFVVPEPDTMAMVWSAVAIVAFVLAVRTARLR